MEIAELTAERLLTKVQLCLLPHTRWWIGGRYNVFTSCSKRKFGRPWKWSELGVAIKSNQNGFQ